MSKNKWIASKLLKWYDKNARSLPWRIPPIDTKQDIKPDPYHTWLSEIMLQQTQVTVVKEYYKLFVLKWPTIVDLASANDKEILEAWAGLGYYRRAHNLIKCSKIIVNDYKGLFPKDEKSLLSLPGVGAYTSAAIRSIAFNKRAIVIDGNIDRIICRLFAIRKPIMQSKKTIKSYASKLVPANRFGDYAQALMDLGSKICTPQKPRCYECPISKNCESYKLNLVNQIPYPKSRKRKPSRFGFAFVTLIKNNIVILERRSKENLLGGMLCFPCSDWEESEEVKFDPPFGKDWIVINKTITHVFSHFILKLKVARCTIENPPPGYIQIPLKNFNINSLPSLMRKVYNISFKDLN